MFEHSLVYMRVLAICLIVNCHLTKFYPVEQLAFGGYLGNLLFYFVSGYGVALSQQRKPLGVAQWFTKRFLKILIPFFIYISVLELGNWDNFLATLNLQLFIHSFEQLGMFFPVLWILYFSFLLINSLNTRSLILAWGALLICVAVRYLFKVQNMDIVPKFIPTTDLFFLMTGFAAFILGIIFSRLNIRTYVDRMNGFLVGIISISLICIPQVLHEVLYRVNTKLVVLNMYFVLISIVGFYLFFLSSFWGKKSRLVAVLQELGVCSLAVYFVHFKMMYYVDALGMSFPFNVISIFVYSFIFSYGLTKLAQWALGLIIKNE